MGTFFLGHPVHQALLSSLLRKINQASSSVTFILQKNRKATTLTILTQYSKKLCTLFSVLAFAIS